MSDRIIGGARHDGGAHASEIRLLKVRKVVIQTIACGQLPILQAELAANPAGPLTPFKDAVLDVLTSLAGNAQPRSSVTAGARQLLRRQAAKWRGGGNLDDLVNQTVEAWLELWHTAPPVGERAARRPLSSILSANAAGLSASSDHPEALLNVLIERALRACGAFDGLIDEKTIRNWDALLAYSYRIMPPGPNVTAAMRCSTLHFRAIASIVPRSDHNTPRTVDSIAAMFWEFCECCATVPESLMHPLSGTFGRSLRAMPGSDFDDAPVAMTELDALARVGVAPERLDPRARQLLDAADEQLDALDQAILAYMLAKRGKIEGVVADLLLPRAIAVYSWLWTTELLTLSRAEFARMLRIDETELQTRILATTAWLKTTRKAVAPTMAHADLPKDH